MMLAGIFGVFVWTVVNLAMVWRHHASIERRMDRCEFIAREIKRDLQPNPRPRGASGEDGT